MNKTVLGAFSLASAAVLLVTGMTGCTQQMESAEIRQAYETALQNALDADVYFWKETKTQGSATDTCQVNVYAGQGDDYQALRDENGAYAEYKISVNETHSQPESTLQIYCGLSPSANEGEEAKDYLLTQVTGEGGAITALTRRPMTAQDYYQSDDFAPYLLSSRLAELTELTVDDMDFSISDAVAEQKINVINLIFGVKEEYLARYEKKHGQKSLFDGAKKVSIEIAYDRIAHVIVYTDEQVEDSGLSVEVERYKFEVVYLGPKFDIPAYDGKVKDGATGKEMERTEAE